MRLWVVWNLLSQYIKELTSFDPCYDFFLVWGFCV